MSRGFVKEDDQEEAPFIPPRAALPKGVTNYVTACGYRQLQEELKDLEKEQTRFSEDNERERRRGIAVITGKMQLLAERLNSARLINLREQPENEIRFGATITLNNKAINAIQEFQIVGVDEADVKLKKIAFIAPIAKALIGAKIGATVNFKLGSETNPLKILKIKYIP